MKLRYAIMAVLAPAILIFIIGFGRPMYREAQERVTRQPRPHCQVSWGTHAMVASRYPEYFTKCYFSWRSGEATGAVCTLPSGEVVAFERVVKP